MNTNVVVTDNGLAYFKAKEDTLFANKVDKEAGKGLSSNDYTAEDKAKLTGIEDGAEVNELEGVQVAGSDITPVNKIANIPSMTGASASAAGAAGVVPGPALGDQTKFLRGDGSWQAAAPLDSPGFTGVPTAPNPTTGTDNTQVATTKFVNDAVAAAVTGAQAYKGVVNAQTDISSLADYKSGWCWDVATAGTYMSEPCEVGDRITCISDRGASFSESDFHILQGNLNIRPITNAEIDALFE